MSAKCNVDRVNTSGDSDEIISAKSFLMASLSVFFFLPLNCILTVLSLREMMRRTMLRLCIKRLSVGSTALFQQHLLTFSHV